MMPRPEILKELARQKAASGEDVTTCWCAPATPKPAELCDTCAVVKRLVEAQKRRGGFRLIVGGLAVIAAMVLGGCGGQEPQQCTPGTWETFDAGPACYCNTDGRFYKIVPGGLGYPVIVPCD